jgi:hypothetical protein
MVVSGGGKASHQGSTVVCFQLGGQATPSLEPAFPLMARGSEPKLFPEPSLTSQLLPSMVPNRCIEPRPGLLSVQS